MKKLTIALATLASLGLALPILSGAAQAETDKVVIKKHHHHHDWDRRHHHHKVIIKKHERDHD